MRQHRWLGIASSGALLVGLLGCGGGEEAPKRTRSTTGTKPAAEAPAEKAAAAPKAEPAPTTAKAETPAATAAAGWGTITGQIVWDGELPAVKLLDISKDQEWCLTKRPGGAPADETTVVNAKNRAVRNVFAYVMDAKAIHPDYPQTTKDAAAADAAFFAKANGIKPEELATAVAGNKVDPKKLKAQVVLDQVHCQYVPHALACREGQKILVVNTEPITHNVKVSSTSGRNDQNPNMPANTALFFEMKAEKMPLALECSIHGWMKGTAMVFDHPYFAVTGDDGKFEIKNVPAGELSLMLRNPAYITDTKGYKVNVEAGKTVNLNVKWNGKPRGGQIAAN